MRVRAAVTEAIEREAADHEDAEVLRERLATRLGDPDGAAAFLSRPFHDCVKAICADLALDPGPILAMEGGGDEASRKSPWPPGAEVAPPPVTQSHPPSSRTQRSEAECRCGTQQGLSGEGGLGPGSTLRPRSPSPGMTARG